MKTTSMRGKLVDMSALRNANPTKVALGNANMNVRGDIVGRGGKIVKTKEQVAREYFKNNPKAVTTGPAVVSLKDLPKDEVLMTPRQAIEALEKKQHEAKHAPTTRKIKDSED